MRSQISVGGLHSNILVPRGLGSRPAAYSRRSPNGNTPQDPSQIVRASIAEMNTAFEQFRDRNDERLRSVEASVDQMSIQHAAFEMNGPGNSAENSAPVDPEYTDVFASWFRSGDHTAESAVRSANMEGDRRNIRAAMNVGTDEQGGFLAPEEWDRRITRSLDNFSPIRALSNVVETTTGKYFTVWQVGGFGTGWVGEEAARPQTSTPTLKSVRYSSGELYSQPFVTQILLEDSEFDIVGWLADEVSVQFGKQESIAFLSGDGTNKPRGILTYAVGGASENEHPAGPIAESFSGLADALNADGLLSFVYQLQAPYRRNATWLMNSITASRIALLKNATGDYIWRQGLENGQPSTLFGYPVAIDENMPAVAAGNIPIVFGDFNRGYTVVDRLGTQLLRDPYTAKPYVGFYTRTRVGGAVSDPNAFRFLRIGTGA